MADLLHMPDDLLRAQLWGGSAQAPAELAPLLNLDLPEQWNQAWRVELRRVLPRVGPSEVSTPLTMMRLTAGLSDRTYAECEYGGPRGSGRSAIRFTWPMAGGSFVVHGSSVRLTVTFPRDTADQDNDPLYSACISPAAGAEPSRGLVRTYWQPNVANTGGMTVGGGITPSAPERLLLPEKATHVSATLGRAITGVAPVMMMTFFGIPNQSIQTLEWSASTARNVSAADAMTKVPIPPFTNYVLLQNLSGAPSSLFLHFWLEP